MDKQIEHGTTYGAYQKCRKHHGTACAPCKAAHSAYRKQWRKDRPLAAEEARRLVRAQSRAVWRLAQMHPALFRALTEEELQRSQEAS